MSPWSSVIYYVVPVTTLKTLHQTESSELFKFMKWIFNVVLSSCKEFMNYFYFGRIAATHFVHENFQALSQELFNFFKKFLELLTLVIHVKQ